MNTGAAPAVRVGLASLIAAAAVFWNAAASGASAASVCARLGTQIHGAAPAVRRAALLDNRPSQPWITYPAVRLPQDTEAYRRVAAAWRTGYSPRPGSAPPLMSVEALQGTGVFVANAILGSADCLAATFIEWQPGGPVRVIDGPQLPVSPCARAGDWAAVARVAGQPAYVETTSVNSAREDPVHYVMLWSGGKWSPPCAVSIRYADRVRQLYCRAGASVCGAAGRISPAVKRRYGRYSLGMKQALNGGGGALRIFLAQGAPDAQDGVLLARARRLGIPKRLVPAGAGPAAWARHFSPAAAVLFPLRLVGSRYLGAVVRSQSPRTASLRRDWLFVLFEAPQASSRHLVPLAAFTVHQTIAAVTSIRAAEGAASPSPAVLRP